MQARTHIDHTLIIIFILLVLTTACSQQPVRTAEPRQGVFEAELATDTLLLTEQAYMGSGKVFVQYRLGDQILNGTAVLPDRHTRKGGTSSSLRLQSAVDRHSGLPTAPLENLDPQQWMEQTYELQQLPSAGLALWREFRDRLIAGITPDAPGTGIVIEFLKQEELYYYYDSNGLLRSIALYDKPADYSVSAAFKLRDLLSAAKPLIGEYISAVGRREATAILFNTGDASVNGYPFILASRRTGQIVFLQRFTDIDDCCGPPGSNLPDAVIHTTNSHVSSLVNQPIGSVGRLFTLLSFKVIDTLTPKPTFLLRDQPIPPVSVSEPMETDAWEQKLDDLAHSPRSTGSLEYLVDGAAFFTRLVDAIQKAEKSVDIRVYIFDNDDYALDIADLLKRRSNEIDIRILIDGLGTITAASAYSPSMPADHDAPRIIRYLEQDSNIRIRTGLNPWLTGDHSKTIIIDGKTAFTGGMNIGREYRYDWHDLMVELHGPVVDEIQIQFEKAWRLQSMLGDVRATLYRPKARINEPREGDIPIRLLFTRPGDSQILRAQIAAITRARQRIYIQNAYFTSDDIIFELAMARRRGVDVRVIIPYQSDIGVIDRSNVTAINSMLENGIRVYIYPGQSHIKGAIYDNWICLGSANFDQLSLRMNKEMNIATSDPVAVKGFLDRVMLPDLEKSVELTEPLPEKWSDFLMETIADQL